MAEAVGREAVGNRERSAARPYEPSWVDHVTDWVRRLPGPAWLFYLAAGALLAALEVAAKWADGTYPARWLELGLFHIVFCLTSLLPLAALHYLDDTAGVALAQFRPALNVTEAEYNDLLHKFTTLPPRPTLLWTLGDILLAWPAAVIAGSGIISSFAFLTSPFAVAVEATALTLLFSFGGPFIYHTYRQLRLVDYVYRNCTSIDIFQLQSLYALSKLAAHTAIILVLGVYSWAATAPNILSQPLALGNTIFCLLLAMACFVWPLLGIHRLLEKEKRQLLSDASRRMQMAITELDRRIDAGDVQSMDQMKNAMESLVIKQGVLDRIPTWPWHPETPRLLGTALLLPIFLYLIQRILQLVFGL